jgi:hypothetical protein
MASPPEQRREPSNPLYHNGVGMSGNPSTTTVHQSTLRLLQLYRVGGKTYEEALLDILEDYPPQEFLKWVGRELKEPTIGSSEFRRRHRLASP